MLLWNELSWANAVVGVVVSLVLCLVFPLPATDIGLRVRPLSVLRLLVTLLYDMFVSGAEVSRQVFVPRHPPAAVIAVQLRCRTDLMLTATAVAVTHVPDSSVVEVRRSTATLFLHVLDADNPAALAAARLSAWRLEALVVRAFGTREEIARVAVPAGEGDLP
jgi:multicomponent Na+:H+ antiporter subunit E